jgi:hypothetical protein
MRRADVRRIVRALVLVVALASAGLVAPSRPVSAGGSSWHLDREHYQPGDTAFAWASIAWAHNPSLGTPEEGPYHAFVAPYSSDPAPGAAVGDDGVPVGDLVLSLEPYDAGGLRFGPHHATLTFVVPDLPPGRYFIRHRNDAGTFVGDLSGLSLFWIDAPVIRAGPNFTG